MNRTITAVLLVGALLALNACASTTTSASSESSLASPGSETSETTAAGLDARALTMRGIVRQLTNDYDGALDDYHLAQRIEKDPVRRTHLDGLINAAESALGAAH